MTQNEKAARKKKIMHVVMWIVLLVLFLCFVAPFILVIINVFKTKGDITSKPLALIGEHGFTTKNFPEAMKKMNFWLVFANSAIITISATILTIIISAMASFVIVRNQKWKACSATRNGRPAPCCSQPWSPPWSFPSRFSWCLWFRFTAELWAS